jgi:hypothetical protein
LRLPLRPNIRTVDGFTTFLKIPQNWTVEWVEPSRHAFWELSSAMPHGQKVLSDSQIDLSFEPFLIETIYQKIVHRWISLDYTYQIKLKPGRYLMKNFCPVLCGIALAKSLQSNISANSKQKSKIFLGVNRGPMGHRKSRYTDPLIHSSSAWARERCRFRGSIPIFKGQLDKV